MNLEPADLALDNLRPETRRALDAVSRALEIASSGTGAADVSTKHGRDVVTAADVAVEDAVRGMLVDALGMTVVGEERGGAAPEDGRGYWLIDPICGTRNFASGTTLYCVNLALIEDGQVTAAVVGDPSRGEPVLAERGRGAFVLESNALHRVSASESSRTIVVEDGKSTGGRRKHAGSFMAASVQADRWDFRSFGSTIALPYLAAGRVSAYVVFYVTAVHAAAGSLLATEAGCTLTDVFGRPWNLDSDSLLASASPELHAMLIELVHGSAPSVQQMG